MNRIPPLRLPKTAGVSYLLLPTRSSTPPTTALELLQSNYRVTESARGFADNLGGTPSGTPSGTPLDTQVYPL